MAFCEEWRNLVSEWGGFENSGGIDGDEIDLANAMKSLNVTPPLESKIALPFYFGLEEASLISERNISCRGSLCELPLSIGGSEYTLYPSTLSFSSDESVLGSIQKPIWNSRQLPDEAYETASVACANTYFGEVSALPPQLSHLDGGKSVVEYFLQASSLTLGMSILTFGLQSWVEDLDNTYPTLNQLWQDWIEIVQG